MILRDIEAGALTDTSPGRSVTVSALKHQFNEALRNSRPIAELTAVFRVWVSVMSQPPLAVVNAQRAAAQAIAAGDLENVPEVPAWKPQLPDLSYIHLYIEARVRKGHKLTAVLIDLTPLTAVFTEETLVQCMLLCAKQRSPEETVAVLRFLNTYMTQRIPFTLALMNKFIENFSLQNDISGAAILYDELANYSLLPDLTTYRSMYLGFARMKEIEASFSVLGHMQSRGIPLEIRMVEEIIEAAIRYDNADAGLQALQRVPNFAASQPPRGVAGGELVPLVASNRCYELLIRAYLQRHELDTVMQIYYELRNAGMVLHSLPDFNQLLQMVAEKISFTDALNIMADRIQAYEKQQATMAAAAGAAKQAAAETVDPAAATALTVIPAGGPPPPASDPIPLPDISSFNVLLHIAGIVDRKPEHIQLIVSELQRIGVAMNTQTFNELIQAYSALHEIKGMHYIYNEFKDSALKHKLEWEEARRAQAGAAIFGGARGSTFGVKAGGGKSAPTPSKTTAEEYASLASFCPDVNTFNLMLEQIEPQRYFSDLQVEAAGSAELLSAKYPSLSATEAAAMQQVESLLADMRSFELMPNASTFKHVLRIMSSVGESDEAAPGAEAQEEDEDDDSKSPHVVRFFSMLMDMVVAHQKAQSMIGGAGAGASGSSPAAVSPISSPAAPFGSALQADAAPAASFEKSWESFLSFLYNSSRTPRDQARNFSYILMCLRRLRKDSIHIPKQVVKTLLEDHLGYNKNVAPVAARELDRSKPVAVAEMEMRQDAALTAAVTTAARSSATDVNLLQSIQLVREFAHPIESDLISIILDAAHMRETGVSALVRPQVDQAPVPTVPTPLLRMLVHNAQRVLVWDRPIDHSQLSTSDVALLASALSSVTASATSSSFVFGSTSRKQLSRTLSPTDRASIHWHIYQTCRQLRQYELAMDTVTEMVRFQADITASATANSAAGSDASPPTLYVASGGKLTMFQDLLQDIRKCATVRTDRGDWDWSLLHLLFQTASQSWGLTIPLHAYHSLMSDALAHGSTPLAYFAFSTAVRHWEALRANNSAAPTSGPNSIAPDLRLTNDMLHMLTRSAEKVHAAQRQAAAAAAIAAAAPTTATAPPAVAPLPLGLDNLAAIEAAQNEVLSQFEMVFSTASSLQLVLAPTLLQQLATLAQKFQSDRLALSFLAYVSRMRAPANELFYIPVISLCSQYGHHTLGMALYSALKLTKPAEITLETFAALLRLQEHAPTPALNAMWALWGEMKAKVLKRAVSPAVGPLMYQFARLQPSPLSSSNETPVTMGLIRDLLVACRSHPPALQLSQDLPQIEELVQAFATCPASAPANSKKLPMPAPSHLIGKLANLSLVFTQGQVATLNEEINAVREKAEALVPADQVPRRSAAEKTNAERTVAERILSGITPVAVGTPVPIELPPQPDIVKIVVRNITGTEDTDTATRAQPEVTATPTPAPPSPQKPLSLGERILRNVILAQNAKSANAAGTANSAAAAIVTPAPAVTPAPSALDAALEPAPAADAKPEPATATVAAAASEVEVAAAFTTADVAPAAAAPVVNATMPVAPAVAPAAPAAPAIAAAPASPEVAAAPVSKSASPPIDAPAAVAATSAFPPLPTKTAAVSGRPSKSFPPAPAAASKSAPVAPAAAAAPDVASASHVPVLLDSFLHWSNLSKELGSLPADEQLKRLRLPETARHVRNLVYNGQLVAGMQQLAAMSSQAADAELTSTQRSLLGVKNRALMIRWLFHYCLLGRNIHVFTAIAQQLQAANLLPKPSLFLHVSRDALAMWKALQKQRAQAGETAPKEVKNEAETEAEERRTNLAPSDQWESSAERDNAATPASAADVVAPITEDAATSAARALRSEETVRFLRVTLQWLCTALMQPTDVWQSGMQVQTSQLSPGKETFTAEPKSNAPLTLTSSTVRIGFNATELRKRLEHWDDRGVQPSVDRILTVFSFKTLCNLAVRGQYAKILPFLRSCDANFDDASLSLNVGTILRSSLQWLVHHHYHAQAAEVWTAMMIVYLPRLKKRMRDTTEVEAVDMRNVAQQKRAHKHHSHAAMIANAVPAVETPEQAAAATHAFQTVQSLCRELLHLYVLEHDDDTMLFRVYATMRSLDIAPPQSVLVLVPPALAPTLPPSQLLLYVLVSRVLNMHGHVKIDYLVKLFGELLKVPMLAPPPFRMPTEPNRTTVPANVAAAGAKKDAPATTTPDNAAAAASSSPDSEWPIVPRFLERIAARFVSEYVVPSWPQRLSKPEFAEMIKKVSNEEGEFVCLVLFVRKVCSMCVCVVVCVVS